MLKHVNDMPNSTSCLMLQCADDSALIYSDKDPKKISNVLRDNLESCNKWLIENKLSLHMGKTEVILFGSKRKSMFLKDPFGNKFFKLKGLSLACYL